MTHARSGGDKDRRIEPGAAPLEPWPNTLRDSLLRLPRTLIHYLRAEIAPLEPPWGRVTSPSVTSAAIEHVRDLVTAALRSGGGLAILVGEGLDQFSDGELAGFHLAVTRSIGEPVGQNAAHETLVEVQASVRGGATGSRGYLDRDRMLLHSDAADFAGLMCLSQADVGGASLFASAIDIHDVLADEAPELLHLYYREWHWAVGALGLPEVERTIRLPIFSSHRGTLSCRYSPSLLRDGATASGEELTVEQHRALNAFEEVALRRGVTARYRLRRGESAWMNNQTLLHGREAFQDGVRADLPRRLLRAWSRIEDARTLWPRVARFDDYLFRGMRT